MQKCWAAKQGNTGKNEGVDGRGAERSEAQQSGEGMGEGKMTERRKETREGEDAEKGSGKGSWGVDGEVGRRTTQGLGQDSIETGNKTNPHIGTNPLGWLQSLFVSKLQTGINLRSRGRKEEGTMQVALRSPLTLP